MRDVPGLARLFVLLVACGLVPGGCASPVPLIPPDYAVEGAGQKIWRLFPSPDSKVVAVPGDEHVRLYALADGNRTAELGCAPGAEPVFSPDGRALALAGPASSCTLALHRVPGGQLLWSAGSAARPLSGTVAFVESGRFVEATLGGELVRLDPATGKELGPSPRPALEKRIRATLRAGDPWRLVFSDDEKLAIAWRKNDRIALVDLVGFEVPSGKELFRTNLLDTSRGQPDVAIAPGGRHVLVVADEETTAFLVATGRKTAEWATGISAAGSKVAFSPDGRLAALSCRGGGKNGEFKLFEVATGRKVGSFPRDFDGTVLRVFSDGRVLTRSPDESLHEPLAAYRIEAAYRLFSGSGAEIARFEDKESGTAVVTPDEARLVWATGGNTLSSAPLPAR